MSADAGSFQAERNKCRTLSLKHFYEVNFSGEILSDDLNFSMIGEVFELCNLGVYSNSRATRKAEASYTCVNRMLLLCGAFEHVIMLTKAYSLCKQELTQICQTYT